jgi:hypothetical protein
MVPNVGALVQRTLRDALGFDPALADATRIRRLFVASRLAMDDALVVPTIVGTDGTSRDIDIETSSSIDRARAAVQRTLEELRSDTTAEQHERRLRVALHRLDVADHYRRLLLSGQFREQVQNVTEVLTAVMDDLNLSHPESAFHLAVAQSALGCASVALGSLLESRGDNCAARISEVIAKLDCVQLAVDSVRAEVDVPVGGPDCWSVAWADEATFEGQSSASSEAVSFGRFVELAEGAIPRLLLFLDAVDSDGLADVASELGELRAVLRGPDGTSVRIVTGPGGEDAAQLQASLEFLDGALSDALNEAEGATLVCSGSPARTKARRPAGRRRAAPATAGE